MNILALTFLLSILTLSFSCREEIAPRNSKGLQQDSNRFVGREYANEEIVKPNQGIPVSAPEALSVTHESTNPISEKHNQAPSATEESQLDQEDETDPSRQIVNETVSPKNVKDSANTTDSTNAINSTNTTEQASTTQPTKFVPFTIHKIPQTIDSSLKITWTQARADANYIVALARNNACSDIYRYFKVKNNTHVEIKDIESGNYHICVTATYGWARLKSDAITGEPPMVYGKTVVAANILAAANSGISFEASGNGRSPTAMKDDTKADATTQASISLNNPATGMIDYVQDQDWYQIALTKDVVYQIDLNGSQNNLGTLFDTYIRGLYDSAGLLIPKTTNDNYLTNVDSRVVFQAPTTGTYFISTSASGSKLGSYQLSIKEWDDPLDDGDDYRATTGTQGALVVNTTTPVKARIKMWDEDWFKVSLTSGTTYQIILRGGRASDALSIVELYIPGIYNSHGQLIAGSTDRKQYHFGFGYFIVTFTATQSENHFVSVKFDYPSTGFYDLRVITDDFSGDINTVGTVENNDPQQATLEILKDKDWFKTTLFANTTYQIDIKGLSEDAPDMYLAGLFDATGTPIPNTNDNNSGAGLDAQLIFTAKTTEVYYIAAEAANFTHVGDYSVSIQKK